MRLLRRSLSIDADKRGMPAPWEPRIRSERPTRDTGLVDVPLAAVRAAVDVIGRPPVWSPH